MDRTSRCNSQGPVIVAVLLGFSAFLNYIDRGNLSIAAPMLKDELAISPARLGVLLSASFWTYAWPCDCSSGWANPMLGSCLAVALSQYGYV